MVTNRRLVETKNNPDFYPIPAWGTKALLINEQFNGNILEPCCGEGDMSEVIKSFNYNVISYDLYDREYGYKKDFLTENQKFDNVITNPPYNIAEDILKKALEIANNKVAILVRISFLESIRRYDEIFSRNPPYKILVFSERLSMYPKGYEIKGGGTTSYGWFIWDKYNTNDTIIKWIKPGLKNESK